MPKPNPILSDELFYNRHFRGVQWKAEQTRIKKAQKRHAANDSWPLTHTVTIPILRDRLTGRPCWFCRSISEATYVAGDSDYQLPTYGGLFNADGKYHRFHYCCWDFCSEGLWGQRVPTGRVSCLGSPT